MNEILDWLLNITGFTILWMCIDYKRTPKIKIFSKEWIKKDNLDQLETIEEEGMVSVTSKKLTEEQKMQIDIIAARAEYAIKYAVKNLENNSF